jgi:tetratricopeptide (TPR) repeat protein
VFIATALALALQVVAQSRGAEPSGCNQEQLAREKGSAQLIAQGYGTARVLGDANAPTFKPGPDDGCPALRLMRSALIGWTSARALAPKGGALELVGPTKKIVDEDLEALRALGLALDVEYAQTVIRAAIAAAQDERPEMALLLDHARDLTERLFTRGRRALWPLPYNLVAGELWYEVDRYAEAVDAFERAASAGGSALAWSGLARAYERLGNRPVACSAYRQIDDAAPQLLDEAKAFLRGCR